MVPQPSPVICTQTLLEPQRFVTHHAYLNESPLYACMMSRLASPLEPCHILCRCGGGLDFQDLLNRRIIRKRLQKMLSQRSCKCIAHKSNRQHHQPDRYYYAARESSYGTSLANEAVQSAQPGEVTIVSSPHVGGSEPCSRFSARDIHRTAEKGRSHCGMQALAVKALEEAQT